MLEVARRREKREWEPRRHPQQVPCDDEPQTIARAEEPGEDVLAGTARGVPLLEDDL